MPRLLSCRRAQCLRDEWSVRLNRDLLLAMSLALSFVPAGAVAAAKQPPAEYAAYVAAMRKADAITDPAQREHVRLALAVFMGKDQDKAERIARAWRAAAPDSAFAAPAGQVLPGRSGYARQRCSGSVMASALRIAATYAAYSAGGCLAAATAPAGTKDRARDMASNRSRFKRRLHSSRRYCARRHDSNRGNAHKGACVCEI